MQATPSSYPPSLQPVVTRLGSGSLLSLSNKMPAVAQQWTQSFQTRSRTSPYSAWRISFEICLEKLKKTRKPQSWERSVTEERSELQTSRLWIDKKPANLTSAAAAAAADVFLSMAAQDYFRKPKLFLQMSALKDIIIGRSFMFTALCVWCVAYRQVSFWWPLTEHRWQGDSLSASFEMCQLHCPCRATESAAAFTLQCSEAAKTWRWRQKLLRNVGTVTCPKGNLPPEQRQPRISLDHFWR